MKFASSLPLDYLSFTMPYPISGTPLYERVKDDIEVDDWTEPKHRGFTEHKLIFRSSFSEAKLKFAILKGSAQFKLRRILGDEGYPFVRSPIEMLTDCVFRLFR